MFCPVVFLFCSNIHSSISSKGYNNLKMMSLQVALYISVSSFWNVVRERFILILKDGIHYAALVILRTKVSSFHLRKSTFVSSQISRYSIQLFNNLLPSDLWLAEQYKSVMVGHEVTQGFDRLEQLMIGCWYEISSVGNCFFSVWVSPEV